MSDEQKRAEEGSRWRRFRIARKFKAPPSQAQNREAADLPEEEADAGSPEMNRDVRQGCNGCIYVTGLIMAIFLLTLIGNCAIGR